jgi:hypothetical protein
MSDVIARLTPDLRSSDWITTAVQRLVLWLEPAGGQAVARRNAWVCLVENNQCRATRLEVEQSFAVLRQPVPAERRSATC